MVVFDATMMLLFMRPDVNAPPDPKTGLPDDKGSEITKEVWLWALNLKANIAH